MEAIFSGKTQRHFLVMLINSGNQVTSHTGIKGASVFITHNVNVVVPHEIAAPVRGLHTLPSGAAK